MQKSTPRDAPEDGRMQSMAQFLTERKAVARLRVLEKDVPSWRTHPVFGSGKSGNSCP